MQYFKNAEGGIEWIKIIIPLLAMWMAWMTYNGFVTRRLLNVEAKLDKKFSELSGNLWRKSAEDSKRHESRIDNLYLLIAGGQDGTENDLSSREGARSRVGTDQGPRLGNQQRLGGENSLFSY